MVIFKGITIWYTLSYMFFPIFQRLTGSYFWIGPSKLPSLPSPLFMLMKMNDDFSTNVFLHIRKIIPYLFLTSPLTVKNLRANFLLFRYKEPPSPPRTNSLMPSFLLPACAVIQSLLNISDTDRKIIWRTSFTIAIAVLMLTSINAVTGALGLPIFQVDYVSKSTSSCGIEKSTLYDSYHISFASVDNFFVQ